MIKYDLKCAAGHRFEAWFRSGAAFEEQAASGEVACPACGDHAVSRAPMAPRIARGRQEAARREMAVMVETHRQLREMRSRIEQDCDYVGDRFAEEARRIHFGEVERRDIYGEATDAEAEALEADGVAFARIPWPAREN
jgi:hypothetical protein